MTSAHDLVEEHRAELESLASRDLPASPLAQAVLEAVDGDGGGE